MFAFSHLFEFSIVILFFIVCGLWTIFPYEWTVAVMMKFIIAASMTMTTIRAVLHHFHLKNYESHQLHQNLHCLCHGLCSHLPACRCSGTGSVPGQFAQDLWWMKWCWDRPLSIWQAFLWVFQFCTLILSVLHIHHWYISLVIDLSIE